jgi:hypothetical protein
LGNTPNVHIDGKHVPLQSAHHDAASDLLSYVRQGGQEGFAIVVIKGPKGREGEFAKRLFYSRDRATNGKSFLIRQPSMLNSFGNFF